MRSVSYSERGVYQDGGSKMIHGLALVQTASSQGAVIAIPSPQQN